MAQASAGMGARGPSGKNAEAKPSLWERNKLYWQQVRTEMAKVTWPTKDDVRTYAIVVIVATVITCIIMGVWDWVLSEILFVILETSTGA